MFSLIGLSIFLWFFLFSIPGQSPCKKYWIRGGGGDPDPPPPPPPPPAPSPQETTQQAIQAQIDAVPRILQTQQEFGPQFTELQLQNLQKFGPEFTQAALDLAKQFGPQIAEQTRAEQQILAPERVAGSQAIADFLAQGVDTLTPEEERQFREDVRASQATRGLSESGFGAQEEFARLTGARQQLKNRFLDVALSASGRLPAAGGTSVNAPAASAGPGQLVKNITPTEFFGAQASNNAFNSNIFGTQASIFNTQAQNASSPFGAIAGGLFGSIAGGFGGGIGTGLAKKFF